MPRAVMSVLLLVSTLLPALACARPHTTRTLHHGGLERTVHLVIPESAPERAPLVLALHGGGGRGDRLDRAMRHGLSREAGERGWVLATPDGIANGWNDGRKLVSKRDMERADVDDVAFLEHLVDTLAADGTIDPERVFVVGISNGGFMAYRLSVEHPERFSTIVPIIANHPTRLADARPSAPVSVMVMNGTLDPVVPYEGGWVELFGQRRGHILSTDATADWWARHNHCPEAPGERVVKDRDPDDGTRIHLRSFEGCDGGSEVVLVRVDGGGHTWPGGPQYAPKSLIGPVSRDADATAMIFRFLDRRSAATDVPEQSAPPR